MDVVSSWPWDSQNKLILNNRREKYAVFRNPQVCILVRGGGGEEDVALKKVRIIRTTPLYLERFSLDCRKGLVLVLVLVLVLLRPLVG